MNTSLSCDIAIIGGSLGGVAAALAACDNGASVILTEATDWLGGQATSQGVSALDEHQYIETFGATCRYAAFREAIRDHYRRRYGVTAMPDGSPLNPGDGWVSALCFEPRVGVAVIETMLAPHIAGGRLTVLYNHIPVSAVVQDDTISSVTMMSANGSVTITARFFLDATDLGDLLPLAGAPWVTGAESCDDTGEADAPEEARPGEVQGFTFCFAVEHCPGEDHTIPKPAGYERLRDAQPFTLTLTGSDGSPRPFRVFETGPTGLPPFWTYRRLLSGRLFDPSGALRDIAMINWNANDYHHADLIGATPEERGRILDEAKRLSLSFLHWLQTEVPRDDGSGCGYPGLRLLPDVMGTADGLSKAPYIRESRRIRALRRVTAGDILATGRTTARAVHFPDSCGVGWYFMDLHPAVGNPRSMFAPTLPFQIPLGALIPQRPANLLAACKNIGTTHLSNGAYRLHPVEWNIGEAAGALAAFCLAHSVQPREVWEGALLRFFQRHLLEQGVPLEWTVDVPPGHPHFIPTQLLLLAGALEGNGPRAASLAIAPDQPVDRADAPAVLRALLRIVGLSTEPVIDPALHHQPLSRAETGATLALIGGEADCLSDPPTWGELCEAIHPLL
ncbi:FAD-dependent oxidoreductase [Roseiflexus sp.]|uniref:FAD-dependent oxidoreductase n=1 Tax=Roseiflexus sp. TaxID=2562120 RepID=UPI0021DF1C12|nr:FAD-dependent oxidoreductase [Roseiflexus sp.]GIW02532.1 MAG: FAD-dependent oxidoreductase [Roseiflexus sp.]